MNPRGGALFAVDAEFSDAGSLRVIADASILDKEALSAINEGLQGYAADHSAAFQLPAASLHILTAEITEPSNGLFKLAGYFIAKELHRLCVEKKEPNQPLQRNASTGSVSSFESPARRG